MFKLILHTNTTKAVLSKAVWWREKFDALWLFLFCFSFLVLQFEIRDFDLQSNFILHKHIYKMAVIGN